MSYRLVIDVEKCVGRFDVRFSRAQKFLDSEVLRDSSPYTPMKTGWLMKSGNTGTVIGSGKVEYTAPHAKKNYYGLSFNFSKEKHPQACAQWFEPAKATKKDAWIKGVNAIIRG